MGGPSEQPQLWDFALATYAREGVQPAVIGLQDRHGADVNILLYCCWVAACGRGRLGPSHLRRADARLAPWRDAVTKPLRVIRDRIKSHPDLRALEGAPAVRAGVLGAEVDSERVALRLLEALAPAAAPGAADPATRSADAAASIGAYLGLLGVALREEARAAAAALLCGAFPGELPHAVQAAIEAACATPAPD